MEQRPLGATGALVSRLGLGTLTWGRSTDGGDAREQVGCFLDAGGSLIDVCGSAEAVLGAVLEDAGLRSRVFLALRSGLSGLHDRPVDASRGALLDALDASLHRLGVEHVDLWLVHARDPRTPMDEVLGTLADVVASGRARYAGLSNLPAWQLTAMSVGGAHRGAPVTIAAAEYEYSLVQRGIEAEVVPACQALGIGVLPWAPLGHGVLTGKYRHGTPPDSRGAGEALGWAVRGYLSPSARRIVEGVARAADGLGVSPAEIALAWVRDRPGVVAPLLGARTVHQLRTALAGDSLVLPAEIRSALDEVSAPAVGYPDDSRPEGDAWPRATSTAS